jgi:hypothetical protein
VHVDRLTFDARTHLACPEEAQSRSFVHLRWFVIGIVVVAEAGSTCGYAALSEFSMMLGAGSGAIDYS